MSGEISWLAHVVFFQYYPFVMLDSQRGVATYTGLSIDLLKIAATTCNFR